MFNLSAVATTTTRASESASNGGLCFTSRLDLFAAHLLVQRPVRLLAARAAVRHLPAAAAPAQRQGGAQGGLPAEHALGGSGGLRGLAL